MTVDSFQVSLSSADNGRVAFLSVYSGENRNYSTVNGVERRCLERCSVFFMFNSTQSVSRNQMILEKKKSKAMQCDKKEKHRFEVCVVGKG